MADIRVSGGQAPAVQPAQRTEAVRAAQRAFFQNALNQTSVNTASPTAAARPVEAQPTQSVSRVVTPSATAAPSTEPTRYLRPGSLLDIKV